MNNKQKGDIAEVTLLKECVKRGWTISIPYGDNCRYDAILDRGNGLERLQIKSSTYHEKDNKVVAFTRRIYNNKTKGQICNTYTKEEIDAFIIYSPELDRLFYIPISEQEGRKGITIRIDRNQKTQKSPGIHWADEYEF